MATPSIVIYVASHKPYRFAEDPLYVPLQVGAALNPPFCALRDNEGDNISAQNPAYCELTGLYWMWKHARASYTGLVHYRRYFSSNKNRAGDPWSRILDEASIRTALSQADILLPKPRRYVIETNYSHYAHAHHESDLLAVRHILQALYPQDVPAFDQVMRRRGGHRFNMFIMRREQMNAYCAWLFSILFELEPLLDTTSYDPYNQRVFGFIGERLLDVWLASKRLPYLELPIVDIEPVHWPQKTVDFCMRKLPGTFTGKGGLRTH